jgi:PAS domain-containing protein
MPGAESAQSGTRNGFLSPVQPPILVLTGRFVAKVMGSQEKNNMSKTAQEAPWERDDDTSRLLLGLIAEHTNDGIWDLDVATRRVFYSRRYAQLVGYELEELAPHFDTFFSLLHE